MSLIDEYGYLNCVSEQARKFCRQEPSCQKAFSRLFGHDIIFSKRPCSRLEEFCLGLFDAFQRTRCGFEVSSSTLSYLTLGLIGSRGAATAAIEFQPTTIVC